MENTIEFTKYEDTNFACFVCKDGGWQLSKELGFHKCSPARDYMVQWVENNGKWSLFISNYTGAIQRSEIIIITVDSVFDVFNFILENKHIHF